MKAGEIQRGTPFTVGDGHVYTAIFVVHEGDTVEVSGFRPLGDGKRHFDSFLLHEEAQAA